MGIVTIQIKIKMNKLINFRGRIINLDKIENHPLRKILNQRVGRENFLFFGGNHEDYTEHLDNGCAGDSHIDNLHDQHTDHKESYSDHSEHKDYHVDN